MEGARGAWLQRERRRNMKLQRAESNFSRQRNTEDGSWQPMRGSEHYLYRQARHGEVNLDRNVDTVMVVEKLHPSLWMSVRNAYRNRL